MTVIFGLFAARERWAAQVIRLRNALLLRRSRPEDFCWAPPHYPADFKRQQGLPPQAFVDIVATLPLVGEASDWKKALVLAEHLTENVHHTGPIRADLLSTYREIRKGNGYCADFVRVFLALAYTAGLHARQWAFSFDGFGGHGHTVVEVFDGERQKWLMIDVLNNFHVVDEQTGEPLGALEYREALRGTRRPAVMRPNGRGRLGFIHAHKAIEYYRRGLTQWYLWWGNAVFEYERHPLVHRARSLSRTLAQVVGVVAGVHPRIKILESQDNARQVRYLIWLKWAFFGFAAFFAVLLTLWLASTFTTGGLA